MLHEAAAMSAFKDGWHLCLAGLKNPVLYRTVYKPAGVVSKVPRASKLGYLPRAITGDIVKLSPSTGLKADCQRPDVRIDSCRSSLRARR